MGLCFLLSGFAALLYQTAWMRQLSTVFGTSELAVATILAAYMAGLAAGAAIAARFVDRIRRPILVYGVLEAAIAASALAVPFLLKLAGLLYATIFGGHAEPPDASGIGQSMYFLASTFLVLAIPTACMGATLPLLTRYAVHSDEQVGPRVGGLYAINTAGAIGGTLAAALLLLPALGLFGTIAVGAAVNLLVFLVAAWLAQSQAGRDELSAATERSHSRLGQQPEAWILPVMLVSGMATFTYEVLWTRLLSHVLGGSVIAFATMLASFLAGIALGSALAARLAQRRTVAQLAFVAAQLLIAGTSLAIYMSLDVLVPESAGLGGNITLSIALLLPATLFIGATFPLAVRILSRGEADAANASARVYSWNTVGAIAGALIAGFVLIPMLRYEGTIKLVVAVNVLLALVVAMFVPRRHKVLAGVAAAALLLVLIGVKPQMPESILRVSPLNDLRSGEIRYYDVGRSATVMMLERDGYFYLRTNGLPEASTDMRGAPPSRHSQRLLAALPVVARPDIEDMMIIGLGGGVVAENIPSSLRSIDIIELEPKVVAANQAIAAERNVDPLQDQRINIVVNDARNSLRRTTKRYGAIVSQPSHPWTAGASHLYTREFMQLARSRLTDDGVFLQWMNLQFVTEPLLQSLAATLLDVFPHVRAYQFEPNVVFFLASKQPLELERELAAHGEPLRSLHSEFLRKGVASLDDLAAALAWDNDGLTRLANAAELITDDDNLLAMQSFRGYEERALQYDRVKELLREFGPLFDSESNIHQDLARELNFVYIADRLSSGMYAHDLTAAMVDALLKNRNLQAQNVRAWFAQSQGRSQQADQILLAVLEQNPNDELASYLILRERGSDMVEATLADRLAPYAENLPDSAAAAISVFSRSRAGDSAAAEAADAVLATAASGDLWYDEAAQLRVDWRVRAAQTDPGGPHGDAALSIIDDLIAVRQNFDIYGMRMAAAYLARDYDATIETARRLIMLIRTHIDFLVESTTEGPPRAVLQAELRRVQSIAGGFEAVRAEQAVAAYKLDDLDAQAAALIEKLQSLEAELAAQ